MLKKFMITTAAAALLAGSGLCAGTLAVALQSSPVSTQSRPRSPPVALRHAPTQRLAERIDCQRTASSKFVTEQTARSVAGDASSRAPT